MKKLAVLVVLMTIFVPFIFAQTVFSFDVGMNLLYETYSDSKLMPGYVRSMFGNEQQFNFSRYGQDSSIGFFVHESAGYYMDYSNFSAGQYVGSNLALAGGPSFIIRHDNNKVYLTFFVGPKFQWYNEKYAVPRNVEYGNSNETVDVHYVYNSFDIGLFSDLSANIKLSSRLEIRAGASFEFAFLRFESGQHIRNVSENNNLNNYFGLVLKPHIGIGTSF